MVELPLTFHFISVLNAVFERLCIGAPIVLVKSKIIIWLYFCIFLLQVFDYTILDCFIDFIRE